MRKKQLKFAYLALWAVAAAYAAFLVWASVMDILAVPFLAGIAAGTFAAGALLAGPPRPRMLERKVALAERRLMSWGRRRYHAPFSPLRFTGLLVAALAAYGSLVFLPKLKREALREVPPDALEAAARYEPPVSTRVYAAGGEEICRFTLEDRVYASIEQVPKHVQHAFVAAEDKDFYRHRGIDIYAIMRAAKENYDSGATRQGGSTISQQVVKNVILKDASRSVTRKLREVFLVVDLERKLSKDRILEIYLNHIFLGHGAYGIRSAADIYFGKRVEDLTVAEAALLAGLPKAPSRDSPYGNFARAKARQAYVLRRMESEGYITLEERLAAEDEAIPMHVQRDPLNRTAAPYFCEHARRELQRMFGYEAVFKKGLIVHTSVDLRMQRAAEAAVRYGLIDLERRLGFNGPSGRDEGFDGECLGQGEEIADGTIEMAQAVVGPKEGLSACVRGNLFPLHPDDVKRIRAWERAKKTPLATGDAFSVRIETSEKRYALVARRTGGEEHPEALQAALVAVDPTTGELKALVGGYDFGENQYNNATQARRQPGSSVKTYVYLAALMRGKRVTDTAYDRPVCYPTASGTWCPRNYVGPHTRQQYLGHVDLRTALAKSLNSVSIQLAAETGVSEVIRVMRRLGITSELDRNLTIAVGSEELTLWEHTYAYAAIAANGREMPRHDGAKSAGVFFRKVADERGVVLYESPPLPDRQAVPSSAAYQATWLMRGVIDFGTGRRVQELGRAAAGKTGTTNDFHDAWFMGYTADLVVGVWVGRRTPQPIADEATGGSVALPIWMAFMKAAHPDTPPRDFPVPDDVILVQEGSDLVPYARGALSGKHLSRE